MYLALLGIVSLLSFVYAFSRLSDWKPLDRVLVAVSPVAFLTLVGVILNQLLPTSLWDWHASRLLSTFTLPYGYDMYYGADSGPVLSTHKGPMAYLPYLPAAIASSPTVAILIAQGIALALCFLPILGLHLNRGIRTRQDIVFAIAVFFCFCFFSFSSPSLSLSASAVHADAPALGLSLLACTSLYAYKPGGRALPLLVSAIAVFLALWAKQLVLPLLVVLPLYVLATKGVRAFRDYLIYLTLAGLTISLLFAFLFNPQHLLFNLVTIASNQSWREGDSFAEKIRAVLLGSQKLAENCFLPLVAISFYALFSLSFIDSKVKKILDWLGNERWGLLAIAGLTMVPTALLAYIKVAGHYNNFSFVVYFLLAAATVILLDVGLSLDHPVQRKGARLLVSIFVVAAVCIHAPLLHNLTWKLTRVQKNDQQIAYNYAKAHPGEVYFPWNPLSNLMAEGKLYHFEFSVIDRKLAGFPVSAEHFRAHVPPDLKYIAFSSYPQENLRDLGAIQTTLEYFPDFTGSVEIDELPGFVVYTRN